MPDDPTVLRIPLRLPAGVLPSIRPQDVILEEGDIVLIESRDYRILLHRVDCFQPVMADPPGL